MLSRFAALALGLTFVLCTSARSRDQQPSTNPPPTSQDQPQQTDSAPTAAPTTPAKRIRIGGNVAQARMIHQVQPVYPKIAKDAQVSGTVVLHAIISKDGSVQMLQFVSGPPLLMKAAMDAVKQWKYEPTLLGGAPVEVDTTISVIFTLGNQDAHPKDELIDPQFRADMLTLLDLMHTKDLMDRIAKQLFLSLKPTFTASLPGTTHRDEIVDAFQAKLLEIMKSDDNMNKFIAVYSMHFTDDDIKAAIQFYSTPAGQHFISESGNITSEMMAVGQAMAVNSVPEIYQELCKQYPELQVSGKICKGFPEKESNLLHERITWSDGSTSARSE
jgi:TonB family protein